MTDTNVPYANATSGEAARNEIIRILRRLGASKVGFMEDFDKNTLLLHFEHHGKVVSLEASAKGWAAMFLRAKPYSSRMRKSKQQYEVDAHVQGMVAINSILRDWVKGQATAVECGILSFQAVFLPYMLAPDGRPMIQHLIDQKLLTQEHT